MHPAPSTKIPFRDIKDHADLMEAFESLIEKRITQTTYGWNNSDEIQHLKSEIAHFLRIQSAQPGVAFDDENNDPMRHSGGYTNTVKKVIHGETCQKIPHGGSGWLHDENNDGPYDVDGHPYCGRCHQSL